MCTSMLFFKTRFGLCPALARITWQQCKLCDIRAKLVQRFFALLITTTMKMALGTRCKSFSLTLRVSSSAFQPVPAAAELLLTRYLFAPLFTVLLTKSLSRTLANKIDKVLFHHLLSMSYITISWYNRKYNKTFYVAISHLIMTLSILSLYETFAGMRFIATRIEPFEFSTLQKQATVSYFLALCSIRLQL